MRRALAVAVVGASAVGVIASEAGKKPASGSTPVLSLRGVTASTFTNWESGHVHPLELTPDGVRLLAVNTADNRLEVFDMTSGSPVRVGSVPVGLDPVSVRARTNTEAWVVNVISDTISVVDLVAMNVTETIDTGDEPADVIFAGVPERAYVTCSQDNAVQIFDPAATGAPVATIAIDAEDPRALAVSSDGLTVYAAIFESGNASTILGGGATIAGAFPPNVVNEPTGPHGGVNPPPNDGAAFNPPINGANPAAPGVGMIVKNTGGAWLDDTGADWTDLVSGANAALSGRPVGWTLLDHDVAIIDTGTNTPTYADGLMNINAAIAVNPATGDVSTVGTDGTNEVRFEPVLNGRFHRVNIASFDPAAPATTDIDDLNPHLTYGTTVPFTPIAQTERDKSLGDPRGIVYNAAGTRAYITGLGSNNLVVVDQTGARAGLSDTIEVGEGPTGIVIDEARGNLYVLNKFAGAVSVVDIATELETSQVPFFDPTPDAITTGRKHLYDTHKSSGLGHASCASCHVDARMDGLAWDLGDPAGPMKSFNQNCIDIGCDDWHPMKGPMVTQTLQDIIGKEPHHWRADREGIEAFNPSFLALLGDDATLNFSQRQEFEDFLATIYYPPNPYRNIDNTLPTTLALPGHFTPGRFGPAGLPLPDGDAQNGLTLFRTGGLDSGISCVTCHTSPTGLGRNGFFVGSDFVELPDGPFGEKHHAVSSITGSTNVSMKIPQLRNMMDKTGFNLTQTVNTRGFGYIHDGSVDTLERFVAEPRFGVSSVQDLADLTALMLSFSGGDLPLGSPTNSLDPPGPAGLDTHAAVGTQVTITDGVAPPPADTALIAQLETIADAGAIGVVVKGKVGGIQRGYAYTGSGMYQSDRLAETIASAALIASAASSSELTWTVVPPGNQTRIGLDRDDDTHFDRDEVDQCADPADPLSTPLNAVCCVADVTTTGAGMGDPSFGIPDGQVTSTDLNYFVNAWVAGTLAIADVTTTGAGMGDPGFGVPDGQVTSTDLNYFVNAWIAGCP